MKEQYRQKCILCYTSNVSHVRKEAKAYILSNTTTDICSYAFKGKGCMHQ